MLCAKLASLVDCPLVCRVYLHLAVYVLPRKLLSVLESSLTEARSRASRLIKSGTICLGFCNAVPRSAECSTSTGLRTHLVLLHEAAALKVSKRLIDHLGLVWVGVG